MRELLPLLLKSSVNSRGVLASEARAVSVGGLLRVVKSAGAFLRPYLAEIITVVSTAMSELEPSMLSYLQFHTASMNMTYEGLEELRLSLAASGPLAEARVCHSAERPARLRGR